MKTKLIKVHVDDKLPDTFGHYVTFNINNQKGYHYFDDGEKQFWSDDEVHEWLLEVPDREEEMREMLEGILKINTFGDYIENFTQYKLKIEQLLNK